MAILKQLHILMVAVMASTLLSSCYQDFEPDIPSTPVLCMNSEIVAGEPIVLYLSRTWRWSEGDQFKLDLNVTDADVRLFVNDEYEETLTPGEIINENYPMNIYPEIRKCYKAKYLPKNGDIIRLEASSPKYGDAGAEVRVPEFVPIDKIEIQSASCEISGDTEGFPVVNDCGFLLTFKMAVYFTDPAISGNYYDVEVRPSPYSNYNDEAEAVFYNGYVDFSGEPLFTEHVSVLEAAVAETSGYTIFSDRQINGKTYPLSLRIDNGIFQYKNPLNLQGPKDYGIEVSLRHVDHAYYNHVISLWQANDAIIGSLGVAGLASPIYPYSNVSTGAGVVAAYSVSKMTLPLVEVAEVAMGNYH